MNFRFICLALALTIGLTTGLYSQNAKALTISEAYAAIPHRQTPYNPQISPLEITDAEFLSVLFTLTDEAMRLRVEALNQLYNNYEYAYMNDYNMKYDEVLKRLRRLPATGAAKTAQYIIIDAIQEQKDFLNKWAEAPQEELQSYRDYKSHKAVRNSHRALLRAFGILMDAFPQEDPQNKKAFFDHLCALDFI